MSVEGAKNMHFIKAGLFNKVLGKLTSHADKKELNLPWPPLFHHMEKKTTQNIIKDLSVETWESAYIEWASIFF